jgi:HEAT repeat protein
LEAALKDKDYWVSQSAADTLAKIKDMRQRIQETSTVVNPEKQRREFAITVLSDTLRDIDRDLRQAAAEALSRLGDIAVVGPLVAALDDQDEWVGRAAALALNHLNWKPGPEDGRRSEKMKTLMYQI